MSCLFFARQIVRHRAHGCSILEVIHRNLPAGLPNVKKVIDKIFCRCHHVFYHQLGAWMLHGMLLDKHDEFFIQRLSPESNAGQTAASENPSGAREFGEEDPPLIDRWTKRQLEELLTNQEGDASSTASGTTGTAAQLARRFALRPEMLPEYIPVALVERILFIGESVHLFDLDPGDSRRLTEQANERARSQYDDLSGGLLEELERRFALRLRALSLEPEFRLLQLEELVEDVCSCVTSRLWTLLVEENDLVGQLREIKDFFLLARGELFLAFIDEADHLLIRSPTAGLEHEVNASFLRAARAVLLDDESLMQRFQLQIGEGGAPAAPEGDEITWSSGWEALRMHYSVRWPFHVLFTPGILEKYNAVFRFLLSVKRAQVALQECWALQMLEKGRLDSAAASLRHSRQWLLRNHMSFLIDNLQYYLQVDVIEAQFMQLLVALAEKSESGDSVRDIERIQLAHQHFVASLMGQAFLFNKPVTQCLSQLMALCFQFSEMVRLVEREKCRAEEFDLKIGQLQKNFQRLSAHLFNILSNVQTQLSAGSPHLGQLLLRLDFNKFYSSSGGTLGGVKGSL